MADPPIDAQVSLVASAQEVSVSREEILRHIFGEIGELIDDFSCAVESTVLLHGRMYITNKFICFYSNLFGLEKKIRIPYSHIKSIKREMTAMVIPNAICISTDKKDYLFRSFWDREECFKILEKFLSKFKGILVDQILKDGSEYGKLKITAVDNNYFTNGNINNNSNININGNSLIGTNSNTVTTTTNIVTPQAANDLLVTTRDNSITITDTPSQPSGVSIISSIPANADDIDNNNISLSHRSASLPVISINQIPSAQSAINRPVSLSRANGRGSGFPILTIDEEAVVDTESGFGYHDEQDNLDLPSLLKNEAETSKQSIPVASEVINISLGEFVALFVSENAPYSFKKYHEIVKDTNVIMTPWTEMPQFGYGREIKFFKPVNLPGLASTRGVKVQRYKRFGDYGLCLCSSTRLEDVPAADTFSVDDTIMVIPKNK
eukprot:gene6047-8326_t